MTSLPTEWPNFDGMPDDETLTSTRPRGQKLSPYIWWDGEVRESDAPTVHYYANALHYGVAVFEGIRCYPTVNGPVLVRLRDHLERMLLSARLYGMQIPFDLDALTRAAVEVTRRNGIQNGYLRPLAYFGAGPIDLKPKRECPVHVFVAVRELGTFLGPDALRNGIRLTVSSWRRPHHTMLPTMAKASGHYANSVLAAHEAMDRGYDDAILLNQDGTVACATGHNVFFVRGGVLHTNDESSSIIPGITRDCVLSIARERNVPVQIRPFTREELLRADEVFLTGTAAEVTPVRELESCAYQTGKGTLGALFQKAYLRAVTGRDPKRLDWLTRVQ
ncbi:MAG TPA: branched-chain amino acid transaminase [Polyangiaceae bacterium]|nr:branched-chain amino acid transaminase [Polyangiaceae bacterium]